MAALGEAIEEARQILKSLASLFRPRPEAEPSSRRAPTRTGSMAMLPFRPTPFFADKNRAFWNLQFIGWGGSMLLRAVTNIANGKPPSFLVLTLIATITGFSISLMLSVIYGQLINQRPLVTWAATALVLARRGRRRRVHRRVDDLAVAAAAATATSPAWCSACSTST